MSIFQKNPQGTTLNNFLEVVALGQLFLSNDEVSTPGTLAKILGFIFTAPNRMSPITLFILFPTIKKPPNVPSPRRPPTFNRPEQQQISRPGFRLLFS